MATLLGRVEAVLAGPAVAYTRAGTRSAIAKTPRPQAQIGPLGLVGDAQGDTRIHGGPDKAVHHYALDHYPHWRAELGARPVLEAPGAFGENIASHGVTEADLCLGDRLRIGSALLEVSQGRQPCWKLNDRFGVSDMALRVQQTLRTGWYYRVIEPGAVRPGDPIERVGRDYPNGNLATLMALLYRRSLDRHALEQALTLPLVPSWRRLIEGRLARGAVEDWAARVDGPDRLSTPQ